MEECLVQPRVASESKQFDVDMCDGIGSHAEKNNSVKSDRFNTTNFDKRIAALTLNCQ